MSTLCDKNDKDHLYCMTFQFKRFCFEILRFDYKIFSILVLEKTLICDNIRLMFIDVRQK